MTYVIRLNGFLCGGFKGADEDEAFNSYAVSEGYKDFKDLLATKGLKRDHFTIDEVKEG